MREMTRQPSCYRGVPVPSELADAVRALIRARGAERAVRLMGLSPLAIAAIAAAAFVLPETLRRARHYLETGEPLPRPEPTPAETSPPETTPPAPPPEPAPALPSNVIRLTRGTRRAR